ncbi:hypothetical protein RCG42_04805 [Lactobacillus delbrueckii subsp. lactis]|nr:hypothetical protein [Lactobacillus delbrueckii]MCD5578914.1 hypothetical protein [Lactobacillus delbrueckii subsp. lactis]MDQ7162210.1 hypothetical protein [Lactobacillus delbrueckii subsp. lactis]MDQ7164206.1 hypothetical protein [Lactobacillus delbrueckii subsp. lactis]MDQ7178606.1 hypothetical protein [Lactobacillus delbrueckii subsp. lactis]MDQ7206342.1 hypothetical protein [Lactobacillus delbrueckii subsp. lactis]
MFGIVLIIYFGGRNVLHIGWKAWDLASFTTFFSLLYQTRHQGLPRLQTV